MKIVKSSISRPPRIVIYGRQGTGKSTFGSECPNPVYLQTEDGLGSLGVDTFGMLTSFETMMKHCDELLMENHNYKTVVVDSLDWAEKMVFNHVVARCGKPVSSIAEIPYGQGYAASELVWKEFLDMLELLNTKKGMIIVLLAHAKVEHFEDPERDNYSTYSLDLQKKGGSLIAEWVDIIGYLHYKISTVTNDKGFGQSSVKGKSTGARALALEERPAYTAKNRFSLPPVIAMPKGAMWETLYQEMKKSFAKPKGNLTDVKKEMAKSQGEKLSNLTKENEDVGTNV